MKKKSVCWYLFVLPFVNQRCFWNVPIWSYSFYPPRLGAASASWALLLCGQDTLEGAERGDPAQWPCLFFTQWSKIPKSMGLAPRCWMDSLQMVVSSLSAEDERSSLWSVSCVLDAGLDALSISYHLHNDVAKRTLRISLFKWGGTREVR